MKKNSLEAMAKEIEKLKASIEEKDAEIEDLRSQLDTVTANAYTLQETVIKMAMKLVGVL